MSSLASAQLAATLTSEQQAILATLNPEQREAFLAILDWSKLTFGNHQARILAGHSGSGKTYLLNLVSKLLPQVVLTAPTNKAVKELKKLNTPYPCLTIYSLLGLRMDTYEDEIRLTKVEHNNVFRYKYVIIDEAGMINTELYMYIQEALQSGVRFLFVGDPKQLPPISEEQSVIWGQYPTNHLIQVMRHDNAILKCATAVRNARSIEDLDLHSEHTKTEGVWCLSPAAFDERIRKFAHKGAFAGETKVLAWRNKTVDHYNQLIREVLFGTKPTQYLVSDRVVITAPHKLDEETLIYTDDEAIVTEVSLQTHPYQTFQSYCLTLDFGHSVHTVRVVYPPDRKRYEQVLADLAAVARQPNNSKQWAQFWKVKNSMCNLKYGHALTCHRAQGSTITNVFVDTTDILLNANAEEAKKCLYVAVSRASKKLFLC